MDNNLQNISLTHVVKNNILLILFEILLNFTPEYAIDKTITWH